MLIADIEDSEDLDKAGWMVAIQNGRLTDIDMEEPAGRQRFLKPETDPLITAARAVGITFGDSLPIFTSRVRLQLVT